MGQISCPHQWYSFLFAVLTKLHAGGALVYLPTSPEVSSLLPSQCVYTHGK